MFRAFLLVLLLAVSTAAWARCFTQTIFLEDRVVICTTCCAGNNCTTTCI